jgi:hypothetical protein
MATWAAHFEAALFHRAAERANTVRACGGRQPCTEMIVSNPDLARRPPFWELPSPPPPDRRKRPQTSADIKTQRRAFCNRRATNLPPARRGAWEGRSTAKIPKIAMLCERSYDPLKELLKGDEGG